MCTQSIEWNLLLFGLLHSNVSNFYSRYWVWFTHDWHFILLNMCSHCGFNVLLNIFSWAYSTFFAVHVCDHYTPGAGYNQVLKFDVQFRPQNVHSTIRWE